MSRKFGWHSGTLTCQDIKVQGDLYVQDDIVFSDVSAGVLGVTGGIDMSASTGTVGIDMGGTFTTGIDFTSTTLTLDASRTSSAIAIGDRLGAKTITMAAAVNHLDPMQINLAIAGVNPTSGSTINSIYQLITHATTDMTSLRLKCADWNIAISKNIKDAYVYQGELLFSSTPTISGEAAVLGLVANAGAGTVSGKLRGMVISMQGTGAPADTIGIELRSTATTTAYGIKLFGTPQITVGIAMGDPTGDNQGPTHAFYFPTGPSADEGPVVQTADSGGGNGSIKIKIGGTTKYLQYWDSAT